MPRCRECENGIADPVCEQCLATQLVQWLAESNPSLATAFSKTIVKRSEGETSCILCHSPVATCSTCTQAQHLVILADISIQEQQIKQEAAITAQLLVHS